MDFERSYRVMGHRTTPERLSTETPVVDEVLYEKVVKIAQLDFTIFTALEASGSSLFSLFSD